MNPGFLPSSVKRCMSGLSAGASGLNWRGGMSVTCMTSVCRGAISLAKPKSRFAGRKAARAGAASWGAPAQNVLRNKRKPAMTTLRLDDLRQHQDVLRLRTGETLAVRFVEPRDAEALQDY